MNERSNQCTLMKRYTTTQGAKLMTVDEFHQSIVDDTYRTQIEAIREAYAKGDKVKVTEFGKEVEKFRYDVLKSQLPLFVPQGDVTRRRKLEGFYAPTGYTDIDGDHLTPEQVEHVMNEVPKYPWIKEAHRSSRGEGVHFIVMMGVIPLNDDDTAKAYDNDNSKPYVSKDQEAAYSTEYKRRYAIIKSRIEQIFGFTTDKQCKDVLRGLYPSYDPKAFVRPDSEVEVFPYGDEGTAIQAETSPTSTPAAPVEQPVTDSSAVSASSQSSSSLSSSLTSLNPTLIRTYLTYNTYRPSERHSWWIGYAQYLKSKGIQKEAITLYRNAMQMHLAMHELIKPDDPLLRSEKEVQDAMDWGFTHSEVTPPKIKDEGLMIRDSAAAISSQDVWTGNVNDEEELARLKAIKLPEAFEASLAPQPEKVKFPTLGGIMPMAQTYATDVRVKYCDGKYQRMNGMSCIIAEQGGLKSGVKDVLSIWKQPLKESDKAVREAEDRYLELKNSRKSNEKLPPRPKETIIEVPPTISCSSLLKRFKRAHGKHLFSMCEEIDTVRKTNGAGSWSAKYDVYRLGFDNGEWGQDYNSDQAESGVVDVAYNWTFLGTPQAMMKCFAQNGSVENGLTGRVWHSVIPPSRYEHMPKYKEMEQSHIDAILRGVDILRTASGFIDTPRLRKVVEKWCDGKADEAEAHKDDVVDTFRKRAAVIGFRAGVIFHILETGEALMKEGKELTDDFMTDATESSNCVDFAILVADHALKYQCLLYGSQLLSDRKQVNDNAGTYQSRNKNLFEELADEFSFDRLVELRPDTKYNALRTMVYKWKRDGLIIDVKKNTWRKASAVVITTVQTPQTIQNT